MPDDEKPTFTYPDYHSSRQYRDRLPTYGSSQLLSKESFASLGDPDAHTRLSSDVAATPQTPSLGYTQREQSPYDPYSPQLLDVISCGPSEGAQGTKIHVHLQSPYDVSTFSGHSFYLLFGSERCNGIVDPTGFSNQSFNYSLIAEVPALAQTGWSGSKDLITMRMEDDAGTVLQDIRLGDFSYLEAARRTSNATPAHGTSRKRKISMDPNTPSTATKRASVHHLKADGGDEVPAFSYTPVTGSPFSPYVHPLPSTDLYALPSSWDRHQQTYPLHQRIPQRSISFPYAGSTTALQQPYRIDSPQTPAWNTGAGFKSSQANRNFQSLVETVPPLRTGQAIGSPAGHANPSLIRTSTIQQSPNTGSTTGLSHLGRAFNPYAMYPSKAVLQLQGELDDMAEDWTLEERTHKRRLVRFQRQQDGSIIHATFAPIPQTERPPAGIVVSCILWEGQQECYVTSVDTIYLLETLVAVRFTVEEKNRIRRNLEGFRPLTVSKAKADSEEFFKVIMGFGNPKPRNIEKDVKVFPWKVLAHALKKIIGKYSASYSSTAGVLPTPISAPGFCDTMPGCGPDFPNPSSSYSHFPSPSSIAEPIPSSSSALSGVGTTVTAALPQQQQHSQTPTPTHGHGHRHGPIQPQQPDLHVMTTSSWAPMQQRRAHSAHEQYVRSQNDEDTWDMATYLSDSGAGTGATPTTAATNTTTASMDPHTMAFTQNMGFGPNHGSQLLTPVSSTAQGAQPTSHA